MGATARPPAQGRGNYRQQQGDPGRTRACNLQLMLLAGVAGPEGRDDSRDDAD